MLKRIVPHWDYLSWARDRFGAKFALRSYASALTGLVKVPAPTGWVYVRPGTTDATVFDQVFQQLEYGFDADPEFIIDAGGHIGLSSVFFAERYPRARIVTIEPDARNFNILCKNVRKFPNVTPIRAGLWSHKTKLKITNPKFSPWGYRLAEGNDITSITVDELLLQFGAKKVGILKLDIEGSEIEVLNASEPWIDRVCVLAIELHDTLRPHCTRALETAIAHRSHERSQRGEITVLRFAEG